MSPTENLQSRWRAVRLFERTDQPTEVCYIRDSFSCSVLGELEILPLTLSSQIFCLFIQELFLFVIGLCHPFWNDKDADSNVLSCIVDSADLPSLRTLEM
jgi:hypothetical protein